MIMKQTKRLAGLLLVLAAFLIVSTTHASSISVTGRTIEFQGGFVIFPSCLCVTAEDCPCMQPLSKVPAAEIPKPNYEIYFAKGVARKTCGAQKFDPTYAAIGM